MSKVRVAFVGSGGMAEPHAAAVSKIKGAEIVGFCDLKPELAQAKASQYGGKSFTDPAEMLDTVKPTALYVLLPPFAHGVELAAVARGIPFFVEKPIGLDMALTKKIAAAVKRKKLITCAGYMNRYRKSVQTVRNLLQSDPAIMLHGGWIGGTPNPDAAPIVRWWINKAKSGGQFLEQVTHTVDLTRFFCGNAVEVHAFAAKGHNKRVHPDYSIEDASVVNIRFASGAIANLWASCSSNAGGGISLNVYAKNAAALFTGWDHSVKITRAGKEAVEIKGEPDIFDIEDAIFIKAVAAGDPSRIQSTYQDAANSLAISVAANQSMKSGKPVRVERVG